MPNVLIEISIADQQLRIRLEDGNDWQYFPVSTAANGVGEEDGSGKTPRGWHRIVAAIGQGQPENAVFIGRRPSGEIYSQALAEKYPERDWILSRILWLQGLEVGRNRGRCNGKGCDSMRRYIYIHGTPDTEPMGVAQSHGCVRMRNADVVHLFDLAPAGTLVWIQTESFRVIPCKTL